MLTNSGKRDAVLDPSLNCMCGGFRWGRNRLRTFVVAGNVLTDPSSLFLATQLFREQNTASKTVIRLMLRSWSGRLSLWIESRSPSRGC